MGKSEDAIGHLQTQLGEFVKQHTAYDVLNRTEYIHTAPTDAKDGSPCTVTRLVYDGGTSRVVLMKEYSGTWDGSWDSLLI